MTAECYQFLYSKLDKSKIPSEIYIKIMKGDKLTIAEENQIQRIIRKIQNDKN